MKITMYDLGILFSGFWGNARIRLYSPVLLIIGMVLESGYHTVTGEELENQPIELINADISNPTTRKHEMELTYNENLGAEAHIPPESVNPFFSIKVISKLKNQQFYE